MSTKWLGRYPELIILSALALITRLFGIFQPAVVVFDEVYFKVYAGAYQTGAYYFDIHPPLGKLILTAWGYLTHQSAAVLTSETTAAPVLRLVPAIAGAAIIPVFYIFLRLLGAGRRTATLGATLILLENGLLVESRFILTDSMLLLFGLGAVTAFLAARRAHTTLHHWAWLLGALILAGCAASTKWTGLTAFALIGIIWAYDALTAFARRRLQLTRALAELIVILVVPLSVYAATFAIHFHLLTKSGSGDAFMSAKFQQTLIGSPTYDPSVRMSFAEKFWDLNRAMLASEDSLKTATHPYGSKWYTWPLMLRGVYFWQGSTLADGRQGNIYLLGNPAIWWGIIALIAGALASPQILKILKPYALALTILLIGYLINYLPFARIVRVMFLYHYFFALIYSLAIAMLLVGASAGWDAPAQKRFWSFPNHSTLVLYLGILATATVCFIYFAPLSYGWPLGPQALQQHMWLSSWR